MKFTNITVGILAFTFLGTLAVLAYVEASGGDANSILYMVGVVIGAAFPGVLNGKRLGQVEKQTNGTLSTLMNQRDAAQKRAVEMETILARLGHELPKE